MRSRLVLLAPFVVVGCSANPAPPAAPSPAPVATTVTNASPLIAQPGPRSFDLPGATAPTFIDYIAYEERASRVWIPLGTSGTVDLFDTRTGGFTRVDGLPVAEREVRGKRRMLGPTSVTIGDGFAYVGSRAKNEVCPVDLASLEVKPCLALPTAIDGVDYIAATKEIWVTTGDAALAIVDATSPAALRMKTVLKFEGTPEGYAHDAAHGLFFTNLEDRDATLAIDVATRKVNATWKPGCGKEGPRGIRVDPDLGFAFVACTEHVQVLDIAHGGALRGKVDAGAGIDNIDYAPRDRLVYIAAGKAARLTVARVDAANGQLTVTATAETATGARTVVTDASGNAYIPDPQRARLVVLPRKTP